MNTSAKKVTINQCTIDSQLDVIDEVEERQTTQNYGSKHKYLSNESKIFKANKINEDYSIT